METTDEKIAAVEKRIGKTIQQWSVYDLYSVFDEKNSDISDLMNSDDVIDEIYRRIGDPTCKAIIETLAIQIHLNCAEQRKTTVIDYLANDDDKHNAVVSMFGSDDMLERLVGLGYDVCSMSGQYSKDNEDKTKNIISDIRDIIIRLSASSGAETLIQRLLDYIIRINERYNQLFGHGILNDDDGKLSAAMDRLYVYDCKLLSFLKAHGSDTEKKPPETDAHGKQEK